MEKRRPEFSITVKRNRSPLRPDKIFTFEFYSAKQWAMNKRILVKYGSLFPLGSLYRLLIREKVKGTRRQRWFSLPDKWDFLTFHEAWSVIGQLAGEQVGPPLMKEHSSFLKTFKRGTRVRLMKDGDSHTSTITLEPQRDEYGVEWCWVKGFKNPVPANALRKIDPDVAMKRENATTDFKVALRRFKKFGEVMWHWPRMSHPDLPEAWEIVTREEAMRRGMDPEGATRHALFCGDLNETEIEDVIQRKRDKR